MFISIPIPIHSAQFIKLQATYVTQCDCVIVMASGQLKCMSNRIPPITMLVVLFITHKLI